jgi:hypothetical protein
MGSYPTLVDDFFGSIFQLAIISPFFNIVIRVVFLYSLYACSAILFLRFIDHYSLSMSV